MGLSFGVVDVGISELDPGSLKHEYYVQCTSGKKTGEHQFCILALITDSKGQTQPPITRESFAEVIERTNGTFVEQDFDFVEQDKKKNAI